MTNVDVRKGNIFTSQCQTLVNTINCDGVMGAGIALEFKLRMPEMFEQYAGHCKAGRIDIGKLWIYQPPPGTRDQRWVLNFPTKRHWKNPSRVEYLEVGLEKFLDTYSHRGIRSIAFPMLGSANGGIPEEKSLEVMQRYLTQCDIPVEIYHYDPAATDDLYEDFRRKLLADANDIVAAKAVAEDIGLRSDQFFKIREALVNKGQVNSLSRLATIRGIGTKTLERCFRYIMDNPEGRQAASLRQDRLI